MPMDTKAAAGDTAVLKCLPPKGIPKPTVRWLKNREVVSASPTASSLEDDLGADSDFASVMDNSVGSDRIMVTETGNLVIRDVTRTDAGDYVCQAVNMVGVRDSEPAKLSVHGKLLCGYIWVTSKAISPRFGQRVRPHKRWALLHRSHILPSFSRQLCSDERHEKGLSPRGFFLIPPVAPCKKVTPEKLIQKVVLA
jgi:hypothetical protein